MKKIFLMAAFAAFVCVQGVSAQSGLSSLWNKLTGSSSSSESSSTVTNAVTNVLGSLLGSSVTLSDDLINGTWGYDGTSCVLESDNALANIGGTVAAGKIEEKLDTYLAKIGVKPGSCSFTFSDGQNCTFKIGSREINGTYTLDAENKKIQFSFYNYISMTSYVAYETTSLSLVFDADKLLSLVKKVATTGSSSALASTSTSATIGTISSLLENYTGMMLGMKLSK